MTEEYMQRLRKQLKGFSSEEQQAFLDEIRSHIESGEEDPRLGKNLEQRRTKLMAELGSPKDLSNQFKAVYRQNRFIDYLWIAIPYFLYPYLNMLYMNLMPKYPWADVRLDIIFHLLLVAIGLWRRSPLVTLFWSGHIAAQLAFVLLATWGYYGMVQVAFWFVIMISLIALLGYIGWQNRHDALIVIFALLPLIMCLTGILVAIIHPDARASYGVVDRLLLNIYRNVAGSGGGYLPYYGTLTTLALFFLVTNRNVRWLALGLYGLVLGLSREYINLFEYEQGLMIQWVYVLFAVLPLLIVFWGWLQNRYQTQQPRFVE